MEVGADPRIAKTAVDGHILETGKFIGRFKQPVSDLGRQDAAANLDPPEFHGGERPLNGPNLFGSPFSRQDLARRTLTQSSDDYRLCARFETAEAHGAQFGEFRQGPQVPEIAVVESHEEFVDCRGSNCVSIAGGSGPQTAVNRYIGIAPAPKERSCTSGVEFGDALQDRMKQLDRRSNTPGGGIRFEDPAARSVPVVYANFRARKIHAKRRCHCRPVVLVAAVDPAGDIESAVDRRHQGACHSMQKGGIRNLVEADVYGVLPEIVEKAGTGQTGR